MNDYFPYALAFAATFCVVTVMFVRSRRRRRIIAGSRQIRLPASVVAVASDRANAAPRRIEKKSAPPRLREFRGIAALDPTGTIAPRAPTRPKKPLTTKKAMAPMSPLPRTRTR